MEVEGDVELIRQSTAVAIVVVFLAAGGASASTDQTGAVPQIVFERTVMDQSNLLVTPPVQGQARELPGSTTRHNEIEPDWSPTGRTIVYASDADDSWQLYLLDLAERKRVPLEGREPRTNRGSNTDPVWSPDGRKVAFESNRAGNWDIWVYNLASKRATNVSRSRMHEFDPDWSPDGERVVFTRIRPGAADLFAADIFTGKVHRMTWTKALEFNPSWSPDGTRIAFDSLADRNYDIYVLTLQPRELVRLTTARGEDSNPDWSPDGHELLFLSTRGDGDYDIYVIAATPGDEPRNVSASPAYDEVGAHWVRRQTALVLTDLFADQPPPAPQETRRFCTTPKIRDGIRRGTDDKDTLCGTDERDIIFGGKGDDRITGGDERDVLVGGPGVDFLRARDGFRDAVWGGRKTDDDGPDRAFVDKMLPQKARVRGRGDVRHDIEILSP